MHPVLLDLCTGVAFPAFPALLAAEQKRYGDAAPLTVENPRPAEWTPPRKGKK
jgi:hypothetical protein